MKKEIILVVLLCLANLTSAQKTDPLLKFDTRAQEQWVDSIIQAMTIEQKIGQLFMMPAYSNKDAKHEIYVDRLIKKYHIGGLIFFQGTPAKQATMTNRFQALAEVPLLIGFDGEWGLDMRLDQTYRFPWNMTLGAIQDDKLIEDFGKHVGQHAKRLGIHINFAPVVDVNINPENPIIGNRSFGESPQNVADKAVAFTKGIQSEGVLANAKHFPGHGDTDVDSHESLPTIPFTEERLDTIELYPYKKLFDQGLASVMVAHLSVPAFEPQTDLPSSLSKNIVTDLLKKRMGFEGLILTDALNMKGAADFSTSAEINLEVIKAGNDILLMPNDIEGTFTKIQDALTEGSLTEERIEHSVKKILKAKYWAGLYDFTPISQENLQNDLNRVYDDVLHHELVKNSITLVKNDKSIFPIKNLMQRKIAYVKLGNDTNGTFVNRLKDYTNVDVITGGTIDVVLKKLKDYDTVIIGYHKSNANPWKGFKFKITELVWLQEIARKKQVILNVFASPYSLLDVKSFTNIDAVVVSYQNSKLAQDVSAQLIFGAGTTKGRLPVSINNYFAAGTGITTTGLKRLADSFPEKVGMSSTKLERVDSIAQVIIDEKMAPGLQVLVARKGEVVYRKSFGYHTAEKKYKVQNTDLYDLASLTKILGGMPPIMKAFEEQKFDLETPIGNLMPVLKGTDKDSITVKEALSHYGRFKAWIPYYLTTIDSLTKQPLKSYYNVRRTKKYGLQVARNLFLTTSFKDSINKMIAESPLRERPGYKYSGLIFYLFKDYLEKEYGTGLNTMNDLYFYQPLGATTLTYRPLEKFPTNRIVPTEIDRFYRRQLLHGYVHDQGAATLGGVNANAGLFSNANDVAKMMQLYLQNGYYGGKRYFEDGTLEKFNKRYFEDDGVRRGLGFDKPQIDEDIKATCGCVSGKSFGHSGYTGTYTWADPETQLVYVFLSNRVYPTADNGKLVTQNIRTEVQRLIQEAIID
jgi:beta-glucosidase-like glycosyl hydrolase/CubicO group peptidase (beta-lactamase class C family)